MSKRAFILPQIQTHVNKKITNDHQLLLKDYEKKFILSVLQQLYPSAGKIKIFFDTGLIVSFFDFATQKNIVIASDLMEKDAACALMNIEPESAEYCTDTDMVKKLLTS